MTSTFMRRAFLKKGAVLTGGLFSLPGIFNTSAAAPATFPILHGDGFYQPDQLAIETTPPDIKARAYR